MLFEKSNNIKVTMFNQGAAIFDRISGGTHFLPWPYSQLFNLFDKERVVSHTDLVQYVQNICNKESLTMSKESLDDFISQVVDLDILISAKL